MEKKRPMTAEEMVQWNNAHPWTLFGLRSILNAVLDPRLTSDTLSYRQRRKLGLIGSVGHPDSPPAADDMVPADTPEEGETDASPEP